MLQKKFYTPLLPWQQQIGPYGDVVLESRVRLSRNMSGCVFPHRAEAKTLEQIIAAGQALCGSLEALGQGAYEYIDLAALKQSERELLVLHRLSTPAHIEQAEHRGLLCREDGAVSVLLNEEDHFSIRTAAAGLDFQTVWDEAAQIDDAIESRINIAFREDTGYVTASPSVTGTGLIAGAMLHLPAIAAMKRLGRIVQGITKFGFSLIPVYGERSRMTGNVFQITNQITLGVSEADILKQLCQMVMQIIREERHCRDTLWRQEPDRWEDKVFRSYGLLSQARLLQEDEVREMTSYMRMGIDRNLIAENPLVQTAVLKAMDTAYLQSMEEAGIWTEERVLKKRGDIVRRMLRQYAGMGHLKGSEA